MENPNYKQDCIDKTLQYLTDLLRAKMPDTDDLNCQLSYLLDEISKQYSTFHWSSDSDEACYSCQKRMIQEALDWPLDKLTPLLMEYNEDKTKRIVTKRLYYPEAGPKPIFEASLLVPGYRIVLADTNEDCIIIKIWASTIDVWCQQDEQLHLGIVNISDIKEVWTDRNVKIWDNTNGKSNR